MMIMTVIKAVTIRYIRNVYGLNTKYTKCLRLAARRKSLFLCYIYITLYLALLLTDLILNTC